MTPPIPAAALTADPALSVLDDPAELPRFTRFAELADGTRLADSALRLGGMHCAACADVIEQAVAAVPGVRSVSVSAAGQRARVQWAPSQTSVAAIVAAIRRAGYDASPDAALAARESRQQEGRRALWRLFVAAFCAMQVMMMATPSYVAHGDELAPDLRQLLNWGSWLLSLPVLAFSAGPFFAGAWRSLRQRRIGMDVPVALGIVVTFIASSGATFAPGAAFGHEVYFDSMTMFIAFLLGGRWLETRARHRVAQVLEAAVDSLPATALRLADDGQVESVSVQRLRPGDRVRVPVGQAFPGDGVLLQGSTRADESLLTGESAAVAKAVGAALVGGSVNTGAPVVMRLDRVGDDTRLAAIVALMRDAMSQRPDVARVADRWAAPFLWAVLLLAAGAGAVWAVVAPERAVWVVVSVLIVTCPCALSLAAPSAMLAAASALARRGVLLQRLDALATWGRVRRVYLDKTGTVTDERLQPQGLQRLPALDGPAWAGWDNERLRARAVSLAAWSAHPLSQALQDWGAAGDGVVWRDVHEHAGAGVDARDEAGRHWRLGAAAFVAGSDAAAGGAPGTEAAGPAVWLGCDGMALARIAFDETLRPDAVATVAALRAQGLAVVLLSGDRMERAERMGHRLGVDAVVAQASPERKLAEVVAAQAAGLAVAMVGDGINDAPVLARADVSVAMGQGALIARAQADATLASGRLADLLWMRDLSRRTMRVVRQNIGWAVGYNLACIPLALCGWLPPWAAGLGMAGSSLLVIANAVRLAR